MPEHVLMSDYEIITDGGRRRRWSAAERMRIVEESLEDGASISVVARRNGVAPNLLYRWRRLMLDGGAVAVTEGDDVTSNRAVRQMEDRIRELGRQLGRKTLEEARFGACRAHSVIEMLTDDGSPYVAKDTQIFAHQLGLKPCFTPVQSPQSNGIAEAFVKTLKRDYVQVSPIPDGPTALGLIAGWFEDYNENHPHSGLKMRSPREFIAAQTATA